MIYTKLRLPLITAALLFMGGCGGSNTPNTPDTPDASIDVLTGH